MQKNLWKLFCLNIPSAIVDGTSEKKSKFSEMENCQDLNKPEKIYLMYLLCRMYVCDCVFKTIC